MNHPDSVDIENVGAEIEAEAEKRRHRDHEIGQLELEIEQAWADIVPDPIVTDGDDDPLLDQIANRAAINPHVPVGSRRGLRGIKWLIRKLTYWYVRFITDQFNVFAGMLIRHLRSLEARLDRLENPGRLSAVRPGEEVAQVPNNGLENPGRLSAVRPGPGGSALIHHPPEPSAVVMNRIADLAGPEPPLVLSADPDEAPTRLADQENQSRGTIVLMGIVEILPLEHLVEIIDQAGLKLEKTGCIIVAVADPATRSRVESELGSGLGISPLAWQHLLARAGFDARLEPCPDSRITEIVVARRTASPSDL